MSIELTTLLLFGGLLVLLALGVPVVFALGGISVLITFMIGGPNDLYVVATTTYRELTDPGLITIPLFLLMGNFLIHSGISDRLFRALNHWLSGLRGGLAIVSVGVCVALAMCGGFGPGILTMGLIAVPAMLKQHYNKSLALGCVMAGGVLGEIIPPSIIMIIFAYISRISIGKIFFGGAIPGFITASLYVLYILVICYLKPELAPRLVEKTSWKTRWTSLKDIVLPVFTGGFGIGIHILRNCHTDRSRWSRRIWLLFGLRDLSEGKLESHFRFLPGDHENKRSGIMDIGSGHPFRRCLHQCGRPGHGHGHCPGRAGKSLADPGRHANHFTHLRHVHGRLCRVNDLRTDFYPYRCLSRIRSGLVCHRFYPQYAGGLFNPAVWLGTDSDERGGPA